MSFRRSQITAYNPVRHRKPTGFAHLRCLLTRELTIMRQTSQVLRFPGGVRRDPEIEAWMRARSEELAPIARRWFEVMRRCGDDVRELLHDGHPTACVGDGAFGYVNAFREHVNVGFFRGAELSDPDRLLEGTGKFMRHVKLRPKVEVDVAALTMLIETAYRDMKERTR